MLNDDPKLKSSFVSFTDLNDVDKQINGFQSGIINLTKSHDGIPRAEFVDKILDFMSKIRIGGTIYICEKTTNLFPYGVEDIELLLKVANYSIQVPTHYYRFISAIKK